MPAGLVLNGRNNLNSVSVHSMSDFIFFLTRFVSKSEIIKQPDGNQAALTTIFFCAWFTLEKLNSEHFSLWSMSVLLYIGLQGHLQLIIN